MILDLFAGPGGWDEGVKPLGLKPVGVEWDDAACRTAKLAGHTRIRADVEQLPTEPMQGKVTGLIMSPPCQDFSAAGLGAGIGGEKGRLITQVLRWTEALRPEWVACEQVPPCIDYWREYARIMRGWGYKTWCGVLCAADYGVPQERYRAILIASLTRQPTCPDPTHAEVPDLFGRQAWISMGEALGRDSHDAYRRTRGEGLIERWGPRRDRPVSEPAPTLTSKARSDVWVRPAPTIVTTRRSSAGGMLGRSLADGGVRVTVQEAAVLQSFPADYPWQGSRSKQFEQVGNAVPPRLARHVVAEAAGIAIPAEAVAA